MSGCSVKKLILALSFTNQLLTWKQGPFKTGLLSWGPGTRVTCLPQRASGPRRQAVTLRRDYVKTRNLRRGDAAGPAASYPARPAPGDQRLRGNADHERRQPDRGPHAGYGPGLPDLPLPAPAELLSGPALGGGPPAQRIDAEHGSDERQLP